MLYLGHGYGLSRNRTALFMCTHAVKKFVLQASFMPVLVLAAKLCPPGVEATLFATLMSISNAGGVTGGLLGAGLTQFLGVTKDNFQNLALLIVVCNLSSLLPLPLLGLLPDESPGVDNEQTKVDWDYLQASVLLECRTSNRLYVNSAAQGNWESGCSWPWPLQCWSPYRIVCLGWSVDDWFHGDIRLMD